MKTKFLLLLTIPLTLAALTGCTANNLSVINPIDSTTSNINSNVPSIIDDNKSIGSSINNSSISTSTSSNASTSASTSVSASTSNKPSSTSTSASNNTSLTIENILKYGYDTTSYYQNVINLTGDNLKTALNKLIFNHTKLNYDNLEEYMRITDRNWERSPNIADENPYMVLLYYTANNDTSKQQLWNHYHTSSSKFGVPTSEMSWDKEHIWAKSNGFSSKGNPAYSDLHHLRAADMRNNNTRSSLPFAKLDTVKKEVKDFSGNTSGKTGTASGVSAYEPFDSYKGDVARALLYMATCYISGSPSLSLTTGTNSSGSKWGFLHTLLKWNLEDLPDEFEIRRNSLVQYYQGNRNPYIDHPEFACKVYNTSNADAKIKSVCGSK